MSWMTYVLHVLAWGLGIVCLVAACGVGVLALAAMWLGPVDDDEEDENRARECEQMAKRLSEKV